MIVNKKGYTIVEVLTALFIISIVGLILVLNINNLTSNRENKEYERVMDRIKSAADVYVNNDPNSKVKIYENKEIITITLDSLVNQGLLDEGSLINPKTEKKFKGYIEVKAVNQILQINYKEWIKKVSNTLEAWYYI